MHIDNLLDQLLPELLPFILKNLSIQDLYNCNSINDTWKKEVSLKMNNLASSEWVNIGSEYFFD